MIGQVITRIPVPDRILSLGGDERKQALVEWWHGYALRYGLHEKRPAYIVEYENGVPRVEDDGHVHMRREHG